jgi:tetratricopeptide (TPR) repeat protein
MPCYGESMSSYFLWMLLTGFTGRPIVSVVLLLLIWWSADRFTWRMLPDPVRAFMRWRRIGQLRSTVHVNPHDRRARFELADLLIGQRRYGAAVDVLKPNLEADHDDAGTLFLMGIACFGSGRPDQGDILLEGARDIDPTFRMHAIDLELGRWKLAQGDAAKAREALERFCKSRHGTVEGRVLLSRALVALGDSAGAAKQREAAWADYVSIPAYQRRLERFWAWRARPSRPLAYAVIVVLCGALITHFAWPYAKRAAAPVAAAASSEEIE